MQKRGGVDWRKAAPLLCARMELLIFADRDLIPPKLRNCRTARNLADMRMLALMPAAWPHPGWPDYQSEGDLVTDLDTLLADLRAHAPETIIDRIAEALTEVSEAAEALGGRDGYDTVSFWWAAGTLSSAYAAVLPYASVDLPSPPSGPGPLVNDPGRMIDLLDAVVGALVQDARIAAEPDMIYALTSAGNLAAQARRGMANAMAAV
jgi:hypothetical protein